MITILHTCDLHGYLGTLPRLAALIARERARNPTALLVDAGDTFIEDQFVDIQPDLYRLLGFDFVTPGNGEKDVKAARTNLHNLGTPILLANRDSGSLFPTAVPYEIRDVGDARIALLGLTISTPYPKGHPLAVRGRGDAPVLDPIESARELVPKLRDSADAVFVVSHLGLNVDAELAAEVDGIDYIFGGHTHHRLDTPLYIADTAIIHAGVQSSHLGVYDLEIEKRGKGKSAVRITSCRLESFWQEMEIDSEMNEQVNRKISECCPDALQVIGESSGSYSDPWQEHGWANLILDDIRERTASDFAMTKAMMLFPSHPPGRFTEYDIDRTVPGLGWFEKMGFDRIVTIEVSGKDIRAILEHAVSDLPRDMIADPRLEQIGRNHTHPANNLLQISGIRVIYDLTRDIGTRIRSIETIDGPLLPDKRYTVATTIFQSLGYSGYRWFREGIRLAEHGGLRDHIRRTVMETLPRKYDGKIPPADGRLVFSSPQNWISKLRTEVGIPRY